MKKKLVCVVLVVLAVFVGLAVDDWDGFVKTFTSPPTDKEIVSDIDIYSIDDEVYKFNLPKASTLSRKEGLPRSEKVFTFSGLQIHWDRIDKKPFDYRPEDGVNDIWFITHQGTPRSFKASGVKDGSYIENLMWLYAFLETNGLKSKYRINTVYIDAMATENDAFQGMDFGHGISMGCTVDVEGCSDRFIFAPMVRKSNLYYGTWISQFISWESYRGKTTTGNWDLKARFKKDMETGETSYIGSKEDLTKPYEERIAAFKTKRNKLRIPEANNHFKPQMNVFLITDSHGEVIGNFASQGKHKWKEPKQYMKKHRADFHAGIIARRILDIEGVDPSEALYPDTIKERFPTKSSFALNETTAIEFREAEAGSLYESSAHFNDTVAEILSAQEEIFSMFRECMRGSKEPHCLNK